MKLEGKKDLAARALGVGKSRIVFNQERLSEIKDAITKQDISELTSSGAIIIREVSGRKKIVKKKSRRKSGSRRKVVIDKKRRYITLTRSLRTHLSGLKKKSKVSAEDFHSLRKEIRSGAFKNRPQLNERIKSMEKNE